MKSAYQIVIDNTAWILIEPAHRVTTRTTSKNPYLSVEEEEEEVEEHNEVSILDSII